MELSKHWRRPEVLEAIFDQLSDAVFLWDKNHRIVGVNQSAERISGISAVELIGKHSQDIFRCLSPESPAETDGAAQPGDPERVFLPSGTVTLRTEDGRERLVAIRTIEVRDDTGDLEGVVATIQDVTGEPKPAKQPMIAESPAMRDVLALVRRVAASEARSILIEGENGTGKDLIARTLHGQSPRRAEPFLSINCAAIPDGLIESELFGHEKGAFADAEMPKRGLIESELFGHEKGAFADAEMPKRGLFELAGRGTLFLDEIGEIPLPVQAEILRVLETRCLRRLGSAEDIQIDIRIIASTSRNLRDAVRAGAFNEDLYQRLNLIQLAIPPLRERPGDILPLARFFVERYNAKSRRQITGITPQAECLLRAHDWPGNVRELRNLIERAMLLEATPQVPSASLAIVVRGTELELESAAAEPMSLAEQERRLVLQALEKTAGNQTQAARMLRVMRDTLRYKMKKFNLR